MQQRTRKLNRTEYSLLDAAKKNNFKNKSVALFALDL